MIFVAFSDMFLIAQGKQSVIHDLDPRTKLCFLGTIILLSIAFSAPYFLIGIFFGLIILVIGSRLFLEWLKMLKGISYFVIFIFLGNTLIYGYVESPKPLNLLDLQSWVGIASLGIDHGFTFAMRLLIFSGLMILFVLTTDLEDLGVALRKLGLPYELVFGVVASARFIPVLINDTETIMKARMVKGVEFQHGNFIKKIRRYAGLLVPLVIVAVRRSYR